MFISRCNLIVLLVWTLACDEETSAISRIISIVFRPLFQQFRVNVNCTLVNYVPLWGGLYQTGC